MAIAASAPEMTALRALAVDFAQIAALVEMQLGEAINAFERRDISAAERIVTAAAKIDALNRQIDEKVLTLLKTGPLPERQLREVVCFMKLAG